MFGRLTQWARAIKRGYTPSHPDCRAPRGVHAIYLASGDPRVPWYAKCSALCVAAYALSPIEFIPDFVPVLGQLDDLVIVPLGVVLVAKLIPPDLMAEHRATAADAEIHPRSIAGPIAIVTIWISTIALASWCTYRYFW